MLSTSINNNNKGDNMNEYYFKHDDYNVEAMLRSKLVIWMIFDGEFTYIKTSKCVDSWFN